MAATVALAPVSAERIAAAATTTASTLTPNALTTTTGKVEPSKATTPQLVRLVSLCRRRGCTASGDVRVLGHVGV